MNAQTKTELLQAEWEKRRPLHHSTSVSPAKQAVRTYSEVKTPENPVIQHLDKLQGELSQQLDSLNTVVSSMQRLSAVLERMGQRKSFSAGKREPQSPKG